ncbi:MAG: hypothetical protein M3245_05915 [Actinomycetota bacterium]|nr:hypothetical protein [Actinomycetota bacterium]
MPVHPRRTRALTLALTTALAAVLGALASSSDASDPRDETPRPAAVRSVPAPAPLP